jgi:hypothetical protein
MQLFVQIDGASQFADLLKSSDEFVRSRMARAVNETAVTFTRIARNYAPIDKGALRASLSSGITFAQPSQNPMMAVVGSNLKYAVYQEMGTGVYAGNGPIRPKRAKMLRWKSKSGKWIFAKSVKGSKPRKFMQKARDEITPIFESRLKEASGEIINHLGAGV